GLTRILASERPCQLIVRSQCTFPPRGSRLLALPRRSAVVNFPHSLIALVATGQHRKQPFRRHVTAECPPCRSDADRVELFSGVLGDDTPDPQADGGR